MTPNRLTIAVSICLSALLAGPARADGPSGSHEDASTQALTCSRGLDTAYTASAAYNDEFHVYVGPGGAEVCNDGDTVPVRGRVIASSEGYLAADGDSANPGGAGLGGYVRLGPDGITCSNGEQEDSTSDQSGAASDEACFEALVAFLTG